MSLNRPASHSSVRNCIVHLIGCAVASFTAFSVTAAESSPAQPPLMMKKSMTSATDIRDAHTCNTNGIALAGIDVVSYHKPTGPLVGSREFAAQHDGLTYRFMSAQHLEEFIADPDKYLPSYLGWCATSLAVGSLTCPNPLNYKLENGALLLFETTGFTNGQELWNADPSDYKYRADRNRDNFLSREPDTSGT